MVHRVPGPRSRPAVGLATLGLAIMLVACGGAAPGDGVISLQAPSASLDPSAAPASVDPEDAMQAFASCMREHGVDIQVSIAGDGDGGTVNIGGGPVTGTGQAPAKGGEAQPGTGPINSEDAKAADEACRHLLPAAGRGDPNATMDPEVADQMLAFSKCMRDHGIDFPDPVFEGGNVSISLGALDGGEGADPSSEAFLAAQEACSADLPDGGPFSIGGPVPDTKP